jgi:hypothetical protein
VFSGTLNKDACYEPISRLNEWLLGAKEEFRPAMRSYAVGYSCARSAGAAVDPKDHVVDKAEADKTS